LEWGLGNGGTEMTLTGLSASSNLLIDELSRALSYEGERCSVPLTNYQRATLESFVSNVCGEEFGRLILLNLLNGKKYSEAAQKFALWNTKSGYVLAVVAKLKEEETERAKKSREDN
jgi:GH24 family phage-related lysozyme (muramidase)